MPAKYIVVNCANDKYSVLDSSTTNHAVSECVVGDNGGITGLRQDVEVFPSGLQLSLNTISATAATQSRNFAARQGRAWLAESRSAAQPAHPIYGVSSKTTPLSVGPPSTVLPYRLPFLSSTRLPAGRQPSMLAKVCRTVYFHLPLGRGASL